MVMVTMHWFLNVQSSAQETWNPNMFKFLCRNVRKLRRAEREPFAAQVLTISDRTSLKNVKRVKPSRLESSM